MTRPSQASPDGTATVAEREHGGSDHVLTDDGTVDGTEAHASRHRRRRVGLSMGTWLAVAVLGVTLTALAVGAVVTLWQTSRLADGVLQGRARALLGLQAGEAERYLRAAQSRTATLAATGTIRDAIQRFDAAYAESDGLSTAAVGVATAEVAEYYRSEIIPELEDVTGDVVGLRRLLPAGDVARHLQSSYTVPDPATDLAPGELVDARDGSDWSAVHAELHPVLSEMAEQLGYEDLYLIAPDSGIIVYSRDKAIDFATSLRVGPYSGSVLAQGFRAVAGQPEPGVAVQTDIAPYAPDGGRPAGFILAPVLDDRRLLGVLAVKISLADINETMTVGGRWVDAGFGSTGETFLVGADGRMRSVSRAFVEDADEYLLAVEEAGTATAAERRAMAATGTTVTFQEALSERELAAASEGTGLTEITGYLGRDVVTASQPLDVPGVDWLVTVQAAAEQVAAPLENYRRVTIVAAAVIALLVSFAAVAWARSTFRPITALADRLRAIRAGHDPGPPAVGRRAPHEFAVLNASVAGMIDSLRRQGAEVDAVIAERRATVHTLLPPAVAARVDAGDRRVVDEIAQASVVVATVNGLGGLLQGEDGRGGRELLDRVIRELDPLAAQHGLDRVKILGDAYFAGCGLESPYLDHAPRAVAFARAAQDTVRRVSAGGPAQLRLSIGIDSGPVTVGLTGSALLVFDMWGDTATAAHLLAQRARPGEILVTGRTHELLPPDTAVERVDQPGPPTWRVTDAVPVEEGAS